MTLQSMRVGIEVGGTFTDIVSVEDGALRVAKVPSTPHAPDIGALNALAALALDPAEIADLVHGSTVATNAVLERKGVRVALLVTEGTRDILALQRHDRRAIYDLQYRKPAPIVTRDAVFELPGRIAAGGAEVAPLDAGALSVALDTVMASGRFDVAVVCLLNAYANPAHETAVRAAVAERDPTFPVVCSHEVTGEFREYERASTAVLSGFVQPVIKGYLSRFAAGLAERGFTGRLSVMQSNGGRMLAEAMGQQPITALLSGPAAGVVGAVNAARRAGLANIITLDMGGTSADVSIVENGRPELTAQMEIDGLPIRTPAVDIATVGAGGGSIAWLDDGGMLRVGPQSAGADPGPASYRRGGTEPTVTDANLVRGSLRAASFEEIGFTVSRDAALAVFDGLSERLGLSREDAADAVIRLAEANIVRAIQTIYTARGKDPREFALVAFGGAGALHAARVAEELGIARVLVPAHAGVLSAAGLLGSDYLHFSVATERLPLEADTLPRIRAIVERLTEEGRAYLAAEGLAGTPETELTLEMRYVGQAFEVPVPVPSDLGALSVGALAEAFAAQHHRIFEFSKPPGAAVEVVSYRVGMRLPAETGESATDRASVPDPALAGTDPDWQIRERGVSYPARVLRGPALPPEPAPGPMLIEDGTTTIFVPVGWSAARDRHGNVILARKDA
ncbi:hydantoinase/oxoprolinase family protein [Roseivivax sp. CAU 1761]